MHRRELATAPSPLQQQINIVQQCKLGYLVPSKNNLPHTQAKSDTSALREQAQALLKQQAQQRAYKRSHFQKVSSSEAKQHQMTRTACATNRNFACCTETAFAAPAARAPIRSYVHKFLNWNSLHLM